MKDSKIEHFYVQLNSTILPSAIVESTGITKKDLNTGIPLNEVAEKVSSFIGGEEVVVFDARNLGFLKVAPEFYDIKFMSRVLRPGIKLTLLNVARELGIMKSPKTALEGVTVIKSIYKYYTRYLGNNGIKLFKNKLSKMIERPERYTPPNAKIVE